MSVTLALLVIGIWMLGRATRLRKELVRYEFENRTEGGVVKFNSFEESERHRQRKGRVGNLVGIGLLLSLVGGLAFAGGIAVMFL